MNIDKKQIIKDFLYDNYSRLCSQNDTNEVRNSAIQQTSFALQKLLTLYRFDGFSVSAKTRATLLNAFQDSDEYVDIILSEFIDQFINSRVLPKNQIPLYNVMYLTYNNYDKDQLLFALKQVIGESKSFLGFSQYFNNDKSINYRDTLIRSLSPDDISGIIADTITRSAISQKQKELIQTARTINSTITKKYSDQIHNFQVNPNAINMCKEHIEQRIQQCFRHIDYFHENLYASMDLGNSRENQEDSVVILTHPKNPNFKMLVVADGVGGDDYGELASWSVVSNIMEWFEHLDSECFYDKNLNILQDQFNKAIQQINTYVFNKYKGNSASTFVGAIVGEKNTIISNVGDSRAYKYVNGELQQLTEDHSISYNLFKLGEIECKDDIRFHKDSSSIFRAIGGQLTTRISSQIISNKDYDTLLLFSDGVTDCLSDDQIKAITKYTSPADLAKSLVKAAKETLSVARPDLDPKEYYTHIKPGKDNATAAVYDNSSLRKDLKNPIKQLKKSIFGRRTDDDSR